MNAAVLLAPGFEEIEALTPVDYLRRAGVNVVTLATATDNTTVTGSHKIPVVADGLLKDFIKTQSQTLDAIIVPGGMPGSANIAQTQEALTLIQQMYDTQKLVCAICAAPALVLSKTTALENKSWTCYPGMEQESGSCAATHKNEPVVHQDNVITGRGPGAAEQFAMEIVKTLCGSEIYTKVKTGSVQR